MSQSPEGSCLHVISWCNDRPSFRKLQESPGNQTIGFTSTSKADELAELGVELGTLGSLEIFRMLILLSQ